MNSIVLLMMPEKCKAIRDEYEMRLREAKADKESGLHDHVDLWAARVATLDTVDAAMVEVALKDIDKWADHWKVEYGFAGVDSFLTFSDYLLARIKEKK